MQTLQNLNQFSWFKQLSMDNQQRYIVYVDYMDKSVLETIPPSVDGCDVLIHFYSNLISKKQAFINKTPAEEIKECFFELKQKYSQYVIEHIFYEVHDKEDSVTDYSEQYPDIYKKINYLYLKYGFNKVYFHLND